LRIIEKRILVNTRLEFIYLMGRNSANDL